MTVYFAGETGDVIVVRRRTQPGSRGHERYSQTDEVYQFRVNGESADQ